MQKISLLKLVLKVTFFNNLHSSSAEMLLNFPFLSFIFHSLLASNQTVSKNHCCWLNCNGCGEQQPCRWSWEKEIQAGCKPATLRDSVHHDGLDPQHPCLHLSDILLPWRIGTPIHPNTHPRDFWAPICQQNLPSLSSCIKLNYSSHCCCTRSQMLLHSWGCTPFCSFIALGLI